MSQRPNNSDRRKGKLFPLISGCTIDPYAHNFLKCSLCNPLKIICFIHGCPCKNKGYLLGVKGDPSLYSHQMIGDLTSIRVYINRPSRAIASIEKCIEKNREMVNSDGSHRRHRSVVRERRGIRLSTHETNIVLEAVGASDDQDVGELCANQNEVSNTRKRQRELSVKSHIDDDTILSAKQNVLLSPGSIDTSSHQDADIDPVFLWNITINHHVLRLSPNILDAATTS